MCVFVLVYVLNYVCAHTLVELLFFTFVHMHIIQLTACELKSQLGY